MNDIISIVVPIYNMEIYLSECIESIKNQSYKNLDIILIDDGSTDSSYEICKYYSKNDERIKVIHQANKGNTNARKVGVKEAKGSYIIFVDADDWLDVDLVKHLYFEIRQNEADIVIDDIISYKYESNIIMRNAMPVGVYTDKKEIISNIIYYKNTNEISVLPYLFGKIFKTQLIEKGMNDISDELRYSEDRALVTWYLLHCSKVVFCNSNNTYYYYRIHDNSICTTYDPQILCQISQIYIYMKRLFEEIPNNADILDQLEKFILNSVMVVFRRNMKIKSDNIIQKFYYPEINIFYFKRIALYGAGRVGSDYYKQIKKNEKITMVLWVDINYEEYRKEGMDVHSVEELEECEFDYILIAVKILELAEVIKANLCKKGIEQEKVIWSEPEMLY